MIELQDSRVVVNYECQGCDEGCKSAVTPAWHEINGTPVCDCGADMSFAGVYLVDCGKAKVTEETNAFLVIEGCEYNAELEEESGPDGFTPFPDHLWLIQNEEGEIIAQFLLEKDAFDYRSFLTSRKA